MSATTVAKLVYRVRHLCALGGQSLSVSEGAPSLPAILDALDRAMFAVNTKLPGRSSVNASFLAILGNAYSYTISEAEPLTLEEFRLASSGLPVFRRSLAEWLQYRSANPTSTGDPLIIAFDKAESGVVTALVWPTPQKSDAIEAVRAAMLTTVFQGIAGTDLTATSLNFGSYGTRAIEHLAAADLLNERMDGANRARAAEFAHEEACLIATYKGSDGFLPSAF